MPNRTNTRTRPVRDQIISARSQVPKNLQIPIEDGNYGMLIIFRDYQYRSPGTGGFAQSEISNASDTIFLPLPENITDTFSVRVQSFEQDIGGAIISDVISAVNAPGGTPQLSSLQTAIGAGLKQALPSAFTDGAEFSKLLSDTVSGALSGLFGGGGSLESLDQFSSDAAFLIRRNLGGNIGRSIDAGLGTFINPKAALSFEGVNMKTHSFNWTVAPKSPSESDNLKDVIRTINKNILPQYISGLALQRVMFKYPSMADIFFVGLDSNYYYFFKTAMIQNFTVNYTPSGVSVLKGGRPAAVQMQMQIIESDIHTAEDYEDQEPTSSTGTTGGGASVGSGSP